MTGFIGEYSPTVSYSYEVDRDWWLDNGGGYGNGFNPDSEFDNDGYDRYGYMGAGGRDRAGNHENDYARGVWDGYDDYDYPLFTETCIAWDNKFAAGIK